MITRQINESITIKDMGKVIWICSVPSGSSSMLLVPAAGLMCLCVAVFPLVSADYFSNPREADQWWLIAAVIFVAFCYYTAWQLLYEEVIDIDPTAIMIGSRPAWLRLNIPPLTFPVTEISELRVVPPRYGRGNRLESGISFNHRGRNIRFAADLTSEEAQEVIDLIVERFPIYGMPKEKRMR